MITEPPYLKNNRLADVIAALQFLGRYEDYKRSASDWTKKIRASPKSVNGEKGWEVVFREHPEFFRESGDKSDEKNVLFSLLLRRATSKTGDERPPLSDETISGLIEIAIKLHADSRDDARRTQDKEEFERHRTEDLQTLNRRLNKQFWVSAAGVVFAFAATILAAWIKVSGK